MEKFFALAIAGAYLALCLLMLYLWVKYQRVICIHSPMWAPLLFLLLSSAGTNFLTAYDLHLKYPELWTVLRGCVSVLAWGTFFSFLYMMPRVKAAEKK